MYLTLNIIRINDSAFISYDIKKTIILFLDFLPPITRLYIGSDFESQQKPKQEVCCGIVKILRSCCGLVGDVPPSDSCCAESDLSIFASKLVKVKSLEINKTIMLPLLISHIQILSLLLRLSFCLKLLSFDGHTSVSRVDFNIYIFSSLKCIIYNSHLMLS